MACSLGTLEVGDTEAISSWRECALNLVRPARAVYLPPSFPDLQRVSVFYENVQMSAIPRPLFAGFPTPNLPSIIAVCKPFIRPFDSHHVFTILASTVWPGLAIRTVVDEARGNGWCAVPYDVLDGSPFWVCTRHAPIFFIFSYDK